MKIALSGASGSGKSRVAQHLHEKHGFVVASTGEICRQLSKLLFGSEDKGSLNRISEMVRAADVGLFISAALRDVQSPKIVLDSVRYLSDVERVRAAGYRIWHIECSADERERRLRARGQQVSRADLLHPSEIELTAAEFDAVIRNEARNAFDLECEIDRLVAA